MKPIQMNLRGARRTSFLPWTLIVSTAACSLLIDPQQKSAGGSDDTDTQGGTNAGAGGESGGFAHAGSGMTKPPAGGRATGGGHGAGDAGNGGDATVQGGTSSGGAGAGDSGGDAGDSGGGGASGGGAGGSIPTGGKPPRAGGGTGGQGTGGKGSAGGGGAGGGGAGSGGGAPSGGSSGAGGGAQRLTCEAPFEAYTNELPNNWKDPYNAHTGAGGGTIQPNTSEEENFDAKICFCVSGQLTNAEFRYADAFLEEAVFGGTFGSMNLRVVGADSKNMIVIVHTTAGEHYCYNIRSADVAALESSTGLTLRANDFSTGCWEEDAKVLADGEAIESAGIEVNNASGTAQLDFNFCILRLNVSP